MQLKSEIEKSPNWWLICMVPLYYITLDDFELFWIVESKIFGLCNPISDSVVQNLWLCVDYIWNTWITLDYVIQNFSVVPFIFEQFILVSLWIKQAWIPKVLFVPAKSSTTFSSMGSLFGCIWTANCGVVFVKIFGWWSENANVTQNM